jgi:hypothetical protein
VRPYKLNEIWIDLDCVQSMELRAADDFYPQAEMTMAFQNKPLCVELNKKEAKAKFAELLDAWRGL